MLYILFVTIVTIHLSQLPSSWLAPLIWIISLRVHTVYLSNITRSQKTDLPQRSLLSIIREINYHGILNVLVTPCWATYLPAWQYKSHSSNSALGSQNLCNAPLSSNFQEIQYCAKFNYYLPAFHFSTW